MNKLPRGICSVLLTPLKENGSLDADAFRFTVRRLIENGVHALVVLGSSGEFPYLTLKEKKQAIDVVTEEAAGKIPVIAGAGAFGTDEAARVARHAEKQGAAGLLIALPIYYKLRFSDVRAHFQRIAAETSLPIIYYHFPETTRLELSAAELARLFEIENLKGIKESIFNLNVIRKHIRALPEGAAVYCGTTLLLRPVMRMGGAGCICPIPNIVPDVSVALYAALARGDARAADALERKIFQLLPIFAELPVSPGGAQHLIRFASEFGIPLKMGGAPHAAMKEALRLMGHPITSTVKSPLPPLSAADRKRVRQTLARAGLIEK